MNRADSSTRTAPGRAAAGKAALVSLAGLCFHNWWDLPHVPFVSPEYLGPTAAFLVIFSVWLARPNGVFARSLVWVWAIAHLIGGGILSVLPLEVLPFDPEQSLRHYIGHLVYLAAQLPLILLLLKKR
jgi:hypothetical protein